MKPAYTRMNADTKIMAHVGYPLKGHALTVVINRLYEAMDINYLRLTCELEKGRLPEFLAAADMFRADRLAVTMPHKADIIPLLDEVDEVSRLFGSVNAVKKVDGRWIGQGFDGIGVVKALQQAGARLDGARVMMIGAGSISGLIGYELARNGATELMLHNRTPERARDVAQVLAENTTMQTSWGGLTPEELDAAAEKADVLVQASAMGMLGMGDHAYLGFVAKLPKACSILECVMLPIDTSLVAEARKFGFDPVLGIDMNLYELSEICNFHFGKTLDDAQRLLAIRVFCDCVDVPLPARWQALQDKLGG